MGKVHFGPGGVWSIESLKPWTRGEPVATWERGEDGTSYPHSLFYSSGACTLDGTGTRNHPLC